MYDVSSASATYSGPDILAVIFLGIIGGILGSLYNYLVDKVVRTYSIINEYVLLVYCGSSYFLLKIVQRELFPMRGQQWSHSGILVNCFLYHCFR